jgi:GxxExxY protein
LAFFLSQRRQGAEAKKIQGKTMTENEIGQSIINTAIQIHRDLGPGLYESVYEAVLTRLLLNQGLSVKRQVKVPINYAGEHFEEAFRVDMIVEDKVIIELKSVERINNAHKKQLLTYLRLTGLKLGYLLNFSEEVMRTGITRIVNKL